VARQPNALSVPLLPDPLHRSHIVNLDYVTEILRQDDGYLVTLQEPMGPPVPVSKQKLPALKAHFGLS
jgi:DNA-binding LytR/AlgR family response regulator